VLTRLLKESLDGSARTLIIVCVCPTRSNVRETIRSLRYAMSAKGIQTKPVVNRSALVDYYKAMLSETQLRHQFEADKRAFLSAAQAQFDKMEAHFERRDLEREAKVLALEAKDAERSEQHGVLVGKDKHYEEIIRRQNQELARLRAELESLRGLHGGDATRQPRMSRVGSTDDTLAALAASTADATATNNAAAARLAESPIKQSTAVRRESSAVGKVDTLFFLQCVVSLF
jgi:hypothetical protein